MQNNKKNKKPLSEKIKDEVVKEIFALKDKRPNLAMIVVGENHRYLDNLKALEKEARAVGVDTNLYVCDDDSSEKELEDVIELLNNDETIDAIYLQSPLPENFNQDNVLSKIKAEKDLNLEEDFEAVDWKLFEARVFKGVLELFKEK